MKSRPLTYPPRNGLSVLPTQEVTPNKKSHKNLFNMRQWILGLIYTTGDTIHDHLILPSILVERYFAYRG